MESDCCQHVWKCVKCQTYANYLNVTPSALHNLNAPWPFSMWGIDVIGPIEPKASNGHRFILVAIDYFTKWVEVASYSAVTRNTVVWFIKRDIITDNDINLNNKMMIELYEQFRISHHNSTPYRPKMNGAVETANKNLKKIIQKMVVTYKDWHEILPYALHEYRTSVRTSTGATPYSLVCGTEAVLPIEVEIPSLRVLAKVELDEAEWDPRGKWAPNYEGPYVVKQAFSGGALILTNAEGQDLKYLVNVDSGKRRAKTLAWKREGQGKYS
ncbi:Pro-Pol polyprotein, partial [Mucuna pruriens]